MTPLQDALDRLPIVILDETDKETVVGALTTMKAAEQMLFNRLVAYNLDKAQHQLREQFQEHHMHQKEVQ